MEIQVKYIRKDIEQAFNLHYHTKFPIRSKLMLLLGAILLATSLGMFFIEGEAFPKLKWILLLMGIFYMGFYVYRKRLMVNMALKNQMIKDMDRMIVNDQNIQFVGENGQSTQEWSNFSDVVSNEESVLFYLSKHNFFILPTRFASDQEQEELQAILAKVNL